MALDRDIKTTKMILNEMAPEITQTGDKKSRHYLRLGYRDVTTADADMIMANNNRESLYSARLYKYARAIKKAKHGKRYAFFSILQTRTPFKEQKEWGILSFDDMQKKIENISPEKKDFYTLIHLDNYYRSKYNKSFFELTWENPNLNEIPEYANYLKKN
jgi:hypothetical protein